jgi:hypothetical protein
MTIRNLLLLMSFAAGLRAIACGHENKTKVILLEREKREVVLVGVNGTKPGDPLRVWTDDDGLLVLLIFSQYTKQADELHGSYPEMVKKALTRLTNEAQAMAARQDALQEQRDHFHSLAKTTGKYLNNLPPRIDQGFFATFTAETGKDLKWLTQNRSYLYSMVEGTANNDQIPKGNVELTPELFEPLQDFITDVDGTTPPDCQGYSLIE